MVFSLITFHVSKSYDDHIENKDIDIDNRDYVYDNDVDNYYEHDF